MVACREHKETHIEHNTGGERKETKKGYKTCRVSEKGGAESEQNNNYAVVLRVSSRVQQRGGGDDGVSKHTFRRAASSVLVATRAATGSDVDLSASRRQIIIIFGLSAFRCHRADTHHRG